MVGSQGLACMGTGVGVVGGEKLREWLERKVLRGEAEAFVAISLDVPSCLSPTVFIYVFII